MYDQAFYDEIRSGIQLSASVVVPIVMQHLHPKTVIDVGCGEGWWAVEFARLGCEVIGVDGGDIPSSPLQDRFISRDLTLRLDDLGRFDLAVCLEVAEHLPADRSQTLIEDLLNLAPVVLFSAAIPGQGGTGHVHERWPSYWVDLFNRCGARASGALRWSIWDDERVDNWYRQNLLLAAMEPELYPDLFATPLAPVWPVVHPVLYDARRRHTE